MFDQMSLNRYKEILLMVDTCQAATLHSQVPFYNWRSKVVCRGVCEGFSTLFVLFCKLSFFCRYTLLAFWLSAVA